MNTILSKNVAMWLIIGGALGIVIGMYIGYTLHHGGADSDKDNGTMQTTTTTNTTGTQMTDTSTSAGALIGTQTVTTGDGAIARVNDQPAGAAVIVAHVDMPADGWIAVHEVLPDNIIGNVLGAARRDAGTYDNVIVDLLRATEPGKSYAVVLYKDNGNKEFDISADVPVTAADGSPIVERFNAQVPISPAGN